MALFSVDSARSRDFDAHHGHTLASLFGMGAAIANPDKTWSSPAATTPVADRASSDPAQRPQKEVPSEDSYALLLDAGDLLDIRVFDTPDLSEKLRVDNRGDITLPVGGTVRVRGLTAEKAQTVIEERFRQRNILHDPTSGVSC